MQRVVSQLSSLIKTGLPGKQKLTPGGNGKGQEKSNAKGGGKPAKIFAIDPIASVFDKDRPVMIFTKGDKGGGNSNGGGNSGGN